VSVIVLDLIGTLVDLRPLADRLGQAGAPETALDAWFERTLHHAACVTLAGEFAPFAELARAALETTLVGAGVDPSSAVDIMGPLTSGSLPAYPEAAPALRAARAAGCAVAVLTNGSREQAESQLRSAGLEGLVDHVRSVEEVGAYKPHPSVYGLVSGLANGSRALLVAAHAWDVYGARAAGLDAVWVRRTPAPWPFPDDEPHHAPDLETAVRGAPAWTSGTGRSQVS
jgi:2-haloacid dehalogenase